VKIIGFEANEETGELVLHLPGGEQVAVEIDEEDESATLRRLGQAVVEALSRADAEAEVVQTTTVARRQDVPLEKRRKSVGVGGGGMGGMGNGRRRRTRQQTIEHDEPVRRAKGGMGTASKRIEDVVRDLPPQREGESSEDYMNRVGLTVGLHAGRKLFRLLQRVSK